VIGTLSIAGQLFGLLQQDTGENMIDLIGPMTVYRGDTLDLVLTVTNDEGERESLTGATIELEVAGELGGAVTFAKSVGSGITLRDQGVDETKGQADIEITAANLAAAAGLYWLDVVVVLASGRRHHVIAPREFTIEPAVNES
jgi:uncharacterized protein YfaS (alpha-2-macroglobulin family)